MNYDLSEEKDFNAYNNRRVYLEGKKAIIELKEIGKTRSSLQNAALHLFYTFIAQELNELGHTHTYEGVKGMQIDLRWNTTLVKELIWRPAQIAAFDIKSTKDIGSHEINLLSESIIKWFNEQGYELHFPSQMNKYLEQLEKKEGL